MSDADRLILTPESLGVGIEPTTQSVVVHLDLGRWQEFVGRPLAIRMSPSEARWLAGLLERKAREAEGGGIPST